MNKLALLKQLHEEKRGLLDQLKSINRRIWMMCNLISPGQPYKVYHELENGSRDSSKDERVVRRKRGG